MKLWLVVVVAAGCAGDLENPARFADCPPGYVEQLFQAKCGECHGLSEPDAQLDLVSPGVGTRLKGVVSASMCEGRTLVEVGGMDHLLVEKIEDEPSCGSRMPFGEAQLSVRETECVKRWVDELAVAP